MLEDLTTLYNFKKGDKILYTGSDEYYMYEGKVFTVQNPNLRFVLNQLNETVYIWTEDIKDFIPYSQTMENLLT